jgi:hypothetical protein
MKKKFLLVGMAALLGASLFFLGCPADSDDDDGGGGGGGGPSTVGKLTITGLSGYNGKFAMAIGEEGEIQLFCGKVTGPESVEAVLISGGQVVLPVYKVEGEAPVSYSGNDTVPVGIVIFSVKDIASTSTPVAFGDEIFVTFANGIGTLDSPTLDPIPGN